MFDIFLLMCGTAALIVAVGLTYTILVYARRSFNALEKELKDLEKKYKI